MNVNVLAIKMMWFCQKDRITPTTVHSDLEGQGKSDGTWSQSSAIWRLLLVVLHSSAYLWWHLHFFSLTFLELWVILNKKSLHYKTIRSEASGNAAGIRCSLPTAAVRDGGGERIWMGGATGWQQRREDCKSTSMSHRRGHISSSFFGLDGMHRTSRVTVFKSSWSLTICVFYCVKR